MEKKILPFAALLRSNKAVASLATERSNGSDEFVRFLGPFGSRWVGNKLNKNG